MCCGRNRVRSRVNPIHTSVSQPRPAASGSMAGPTFEYVGRTALTVFGPITGAPYRFQGPGSRLQVHSRDQRALLNVPVLKFVG